MFKTTLASCLLLSGFVVIGFSSPASAITQSALGQQAGQNTSTQTTKSSAAKSVKPAAPKPTTAKKAPPKPLVYVEDNRNPAKPADAKTGDKTDQSASAKSAATAGKPGDGSVKKTSASTTQAGVAHTANTTTQKPLSADVTKAFVQNCPSVELTSSKSKAAYEVMLDREQGSKGVKSAFGLRKTNRIDVMNKSGKELFSESGHSTNQLVKDACTTMGTPTTRIAKN
jgi:hypothetical protein